MAAYKPLFKHFTDENGLNFYLPNDLDTRHLAIGTCVMQGLYSAAKASNSKGKMPRLEFEMSFIDKALRDYVAGQCAPELLAKSTTAIKDKLATDDQVPANYLIHTARTELHKPGSTLDSKLIFTGSKLDHLVMQYGVAKSISKNRTTDYEAVQAAIKSMNLK
jgi:hypothetical protein